jgi:hypothetical protein
MSDTQLAPELTDAGAMERMFLLETRDPSSPSYDRAASIKAMRWMKQVVDNRLAAPRRSRFGEPANAQTETDIISVGNQFYGFGEYPKLSPAFQHKLALILRVAGSKSDARSEAFAGFVSDAITAATEISAPTEARVLNLAAWRTENTKSPGGDFRFYMTLQGNTFYTAAPIPPMPRRSRKRNHYR